MEDEEFYNVEDEVMTLMAQHEGNGHTIASINPKDYDTVDKVIETKKKYEHLNYNPVGRTMKVAEVAWAALVRLIVLGQPL